MRTNIPIEENGYFRIKNPSTYVNLKHWDMNDFPVYPDGLKNL